MSYRGRFHPTDPEKYRGDHRNIVYRSLWERSLMRFLDSQPGVVEWSSESTVVPYRCPTDGRVHRYFVDFWIRLRSGGVFLVEVKPAREKVPPRQPRRRTGRFLLEAATYAKNQAKWEAAREYAADRGWRFEVWDENDLRRMGIPVGGKRSTD